MVVRLVEIRYMKFVGFNLDLWSLRRRGFELGLIEISGPKLASFDCCLNDEIEVMIGMVEMVA